MKRSAFTLIEVTISVAIAVVLMLGISQVFKIVGDTVGTGQALATAQRDGRSVQQVMSSDFNSAVTDGAPYMMLYGGRVFAFNNANDLAGDKDGDPSTADLAGTGTEVPLSAALYNSRSHRIDAFSFFGRGQFNRQTGADEPSFGASPFVSNMSSPEALLWYGHLNLANNGGTFSVGGSDNSPGVGASTPGSLSYFRTINPNNYFATSWILGRQQILLADRTALDNYNQTVTPSAIVDNSYPGVDQYAYTTGGGVILAPLAVASVAYKSSVPGTGTLTSSTVTSFTAQSSRIDLANTSIAEYRNIISSAIPSNPNWWRLLFCGTPTARFQAQPFFLKKPATPETVAYQAPIFVRGCTQFTVEYAGDYLNQNPVGATVANQGITDTYVHADGTTGTTDGQIDYVYASGSGQNAVRQIRWYGLPRSTANGVKINGLLGDVVPLRDIFAAVISAAVATKPPPAQAPFEEQVPVLPSMIPMSVDYAPVGAMSQTTAYTCAWGPNDRKPKMIRITMTVDDPGGRLGDGQTFEYIYTLP